MVVIEGKCGKLKRISKFVENGINDNSNLKIICFSKEAVNLKNTNNIIIENGVYDLFSLSEEEIISTVKGYDWVIIYDNVIKDALVDFHSIEEIIRKPIIISCKTSRSELVEYRFKE